MTTQWRVIVDKKPWDLDVKLYVVGQNDQNKTVVMSTAVLTVAAESGYVSDAQPWFQSMGDYETKALLQAMMNAAWEMGLRPPAYDAPTSELRATKDHLSDMRKIVASRLEIAL